MKCSIRIKYAFFFYFILVLYFLFMSPQVFASKYYQITRVEIDAQLYPDGSMEVIESRTYRFVESFSYVYRVLPTTGPVTFQDFRVTENGQLYRQSESKDPGTFYIAQKQGKIEVRWFFHASNESRIFDFHYRVKDAIKCYEDTAVLYFQFISGDWDRWSKNVRLHLKPPVTLSKTQINEWLHGPLWAESRIEHDGSITA